LSIVPGYFIINNYGANVEFTNPDSIKFSNLNINSPDYKPGNFQLSKRPDRSFGNTWSQDSDSASIFHFSPGGSTLSWKDCKNITSLGQFVIVNKGEISVGVPEEQILQIYKTEVSDLYPNPSKEWLTIDIASEYPQMAALTLIDTEGNTIIKISEELREGKNTILIRLPQLPGGLYLVNIKLQNGCKVIRKLLIE
jgi:hypothetical protein